MIDNELLRQLGWSKELINEVNRIAEPIRQASNMTKISSGVTALNYSVSNTVTVANAIYTEYNEKAASQSLLTSAKG